jgi:hypothetical protein
VKIYHYDQTTLEFIGVGEAERDQLDTESYLLPAQSTTIEPVVSDVGYVCVFNDDGWLNVVDNRGVTYWSIDGVKHTISEIGVTLPDDALTEAPDPAPLTAGDIDRLRAIAYAEPITGSDRYFIEAARKRATGDETGATEAEQLGVTRVTEIKEAIQ